MADVSAMDQPGLPWLVTSGLHTISRTVKATCETVCSASSHVSISPQAVQQMADGITTDKLKALGAPAAFNKELHYVDGGPLTVQYLLVVDALNFCFWPDPELEYEHLAGGIKASILADPTALSANKLAQITGDGVRQLVGWKRDLPLQEERARLLREVGTALLASFRGEAAHMVEAAGGSAQALVHLVTQHLSGFRDHAVYKGQQVFLYKRAQIFVGDVFGAFVGEGLGSFRDIDQLTMFADYRVPVVLRQMGILEYSLELAGKVERQELIQAGSEEEIEIRACSIVAVDRIRQALASKCLQDAPGQPLPHAIQLDWYLWEIGEAQRANSATPHHRTLTVYY